MTAKQRKKPRIYNYLVSGILKCGDCGSHFVATCGSNHSGEKFFYYFCPRSKSKMGCDTQPISATAFDSALIDYFKRASENKELIVKAFGNSVLASKIKLAKVEKALREPEDKLKATKNEAERLLDLALKDAIPQGSVYKTRMLALETEIITLEDKIAKLQAQKSIAQISVNSNDYLFSNIKAAMKNMQDAPSEIQKSILMTLIKEILVHDTQVELKMYLWPPIDTNDTPHHACPASRKITPWRPRKCPKQAQKQKAPHQ